MTTMTLTAQEAAQIRAQRWRLDPNNIGRARITWQAESRRWRVTVSNLGFTRAAEFREVERVTPFVRAELEAILDDVNELLRSEP